MSINANATVPVPLELTPSAVIMTMTGSANSVLGTENDAVEIESGYGSMTLSNFKAQINNEVIVEATHGSMSLSGLACEEIVYTPATNDNDIDAGNEVMYLSSIDAFVDRPPNIEEIPDLTLYLDATATDLVSLYVNDLDSRVTDSQVLNINTSYATYTHAAGIVAVAETTVGATELTGLRLEVTYT